VIEDDQTPSASALPSSQAIIWSLHLSSHRDTIVACQDTTLRRISGVPTYAPTDNERTVSVDHVAEVAVRHPEIVQVGRHYGMTIRIAGLRLGPHSSPGRGPG
jgi:hypothetical protein